MRFLNFLNEKVSKSEIDSILNNKDILVGSEFEFYLYKNDFAAEGSIDGYTYKEIWNEWDSFTDAVNEWQKEYEKESEKIEEKITKLEKDKDRLQDKIDLLEEPDDITDSSKYEKRLNDLEEQVSDIEKEIEELEDERMELPDNLGFLGFPRELEVYVQYIGDETEYYDNIYMEIIENFDGLWQKLMRIEPNEDVFQVDSEQALDSVSGYIESELGIDVITNYSPDINDKNWGLTTDSSLDSDELGMELISPPLPLPDFVKIVPKVLDFINDNGYTDRSTGYHVHMSVKGKELVNDLDITKLFLFHSEEYVYKNFKEREGSRYSISVKDQLEKESLKHIDFKKFIKIEKMKEKLQNTATSKFYGINLSDIEDNHMEYRYMGGRNYQEKQKEIIRTVANYAFNLYLATEPTFKQKEYVKKLLKMITHFHEKNKEDYLAIVFCSYLIDKLWKDYPNKSEVLESIERLRKLRDSYMKDITLEDAVKIYRSLDYSDKEIKTMSNVLMDFLLQKISPWDKKELYQFIKKILKNPQLVKKGFPNDFLIRSKFLK